MANTERSRAAARAALEAYKAQPGFDTGDDAVTLEDLVADLALFADTLNDTNGWQVLVTAQDHYDAELAEDS